MVPIPTIVTVEPDTVATPVLLDEYVIAPVPALLIGAVNANGASVVVLLISAHEDNVGWNSQGQLVHFDWWMRLHSDYNETKYQTTPRRLNKPVKYDASGIDTPNDPTM